MSPIRRAKRYVDEGRLKEIREQLLAAIEELEQAKRHCAVGNLHREVRRAGNTPPVSIAWAKPPARPLLGR